MSATMTVSHNHAKPYRSFLKGSFNDLVRKEVLRKDRDSRSFPCDCKCQRCRASSRSEKNLNKAPWTDCYPKGYLDQRSSSKPCLSKHFIHCRFNILKSPIIEEENSECEEPKLSLPERAPGYGREENLKMKMEKDEVQEESKPDTERFGDLLWDKSLGNIVNNTILSAPAFNISLV